MVPVYIYRYRKAANRFAALANRSRGSLSRGRAGCANALLMRVMVLLASLVGCATSATQIAPPTPWFSPAAFINASATPKSWQSLWSSGGTDMSIAGVATLLVSANASTGVAFDDCRSGLALISYQLPFFVSTMGMPPVVQTRQAAASSSSSSAPAGGGMSSFFRRMMGVRAADEPCAASRRVRPFRIAIASSNQVCARLRVRIKCVRDCEFELSARAIASPNNEVCARLRWCSKMMVETASGIVKPRPKMDVLLYLMRLQARFCEIVMNSMPAGPMLGDMGSYQVIQYHTDTILASMGHEHGIPLEVYHLNLLATC